MSEEDKVRYIELKLNEIKKNVEERDKEIEKLKSIINNAIKRIEDYYYRNKEYKKDYILAFEMYHILKGSEQE